jgi:hypothetical protein
MTKMYQFDPQISAACSEIAQQRNFRKVNLRSIGGDKKLERGMVNAQASVPFLDRVNGCSDER